MPKQNYLFIQRSQPGKGEKWAIEVARESPGVSMPGSSVEIREIHTP